MSDADAEFAHLVGGQEAGAREVRFKSQRTIQLGRVPIDS
jgi:hypothetical protein